jgi:hypothetical protein
MLERRRAAIRFLDLGWPAKCITRPARHGIARIGHRVQSVERAECVFCFAVLGGLRVELN